MIRSFVFSQGKLLNEDVGLDVLRVVLFDEDVQIWVDVEKPTPEETKAVLEDVFGFHPLAIEDCLAVSERPKVDDYEQYLFMVIHAVDYMHSLHVFQTTELNTFIGKNFLVTFHDDPLRSIKSTVDRVHKNAQAVARAPDRLAYYVLDALFDNYQPALNELSGEIADLEKRALTDPTADILPEVVQLKTEVQRLRQIINPQREVITQIARGDFRKIIRATLQPYFRDLLDQLARIADLSDNYRDSINSTLQIHLNIQQMSINHVIKTLTVLATLATPLVIITSFYGMNFDLPEFKIWPAYSHLYVVGVIAAMCGALYWYLKRQNWL